MFQINFSEISSAEMAQLPKSLQMEILSEFEVLNPNFIETHPDKFGQLVRDDRVLYRYRTRDYRIYFEKAEKGILIHRVIHKNTMKDFFYRSKLPMVEDEVLQDQADFWEWIDKPQNNTLDRGQ